MKANRPIKAVTGNLRHRTVYEAGFMIQALVMASMINNDGELREILTRALRMTLPAVMAEPLATAVQEGHSLPSAPSLSRWRFLLDAAFMLHRRKQLTAEAERHVRFCMLDSSTQGGKDYELMLMTTMKRSCLAEAFRKANALILCRIDFFK